MSPLRNIIVRGLPYPEDSTLGWASVNKSPYFCSTCCNLYAGCTLSLMPRRDIYMFETESSFENIEDAKRNGTYDDVEPVPVWAKESRTDYTSWAFSAPMPDLMHKAEEGCPSCAVIVTGVMSFCKEELSHVRSDIEIRITFCKGNLLRASVWSTGFNSYTEMSDNDLDIWGEQSYRLCESELINMIEFYTLPEKPCPWPTIGPSTKWTDPVNNTILGHGGLTSHIPTDLSVSEVVKLVKSWQGRCATMHPICEELISKHRSLTPKRLIDVGKADNQSIRIIHPGDAESEMTVLYVALSHCWGGHQLLVSTKTTIEALKQQIPWEELPRTFRDAISVTRCLGIRYIWIDSLCIVQNDILDWETEAAKMGTIYSNAELVISATASLDGTRGLIFPRPTQLSIAGLDQRGLPFQIFAREMLPHDRFNWEGSIAGLRTSNTRSENVPRVDPDYPLLTRAWCFQERLLGSRVLHFTKYEVVYECLTGLNCECGSMTDFPEPWMLPLRRHAASGSQHTQRVLSLSLEIDQPTLGLFPEYVVKKPMRQNLKTDKVDILWDWRILVGDYSSKSITRSSDWLPALSGIASRYHCSDTGSYLAGMWSRDLLRCLLWKVAMDAPEREQDPDYIAPSWSWASVRRSVTWLGRGSLGSTFFVEIDLRKSGTSLKTEDRFGAVMGGWLYVTGFVAEAVFVGTTQVSFGRSIGRINVGGKGISFWLDDQQRLAKLDSHEVFLLKFCLDVGFERFLVLSHAPDPELARLPPEVLGFPLICWRIGIVDMMDKDIELPEMTKVSMYIV